MSSISFSSEEYDVAGSVANPNKECELPAHTKNLLLTGRRDQVSFGIVCLANGAYRHSKIGIKDDSSWWISAFAHIAKRITAEKGFKNLNPPTNIAAEMSGEDLYNAVVKYIDDYMRLHGRAQRVYNEAINTIAEALVDALR